LQFYQNKIEYLVNILAAVNTNDMFKILENITGGLTLDVVLSKRLEIASITNNVYNPDQIKKLSFSDMMELLHFYQAKINILNNERQ
jgi:hypothetical protein